MEILGRVAEHSFDILQTVSILAGFFTAAFTIRANTRERKIANLFALTNAHREIWSLLYERKELSRVLSKSVNLRTDPVTTEEELFVHTLILHLRAAFKARELGMQFDDGAVAADVREMFVLPIPRDVWERSNVFQDSDFVAFVERCIAKPESAKRAA